ncbi:TPR-like protein [Exidia glandulosa HHB12029]|uniref:TPR-like protein n=1 Tax=Exidia glandulosa HHB12029 TaxID=1314781 RepID=A0A165K3F7_EXIGL|nr:TPR-like protein [Exidia glandulosa HHB12029]
MHSTSLSPTDSVDPGAIAQKDTTIPAQSSAIPVSPSSPALISQSPPVAAHHPDNLGPRTMRTVALGAVTTVGLAAVAPLTVAETRVAGDGAFNLTLALAAVRHAAESVREQSRRAKQNKKTAFQVGDTAVSLFNALVAAEVAMPLVDVITNSERIMRLFGHARDQFRGTETASRIRLPHGKKNADEFQKILDEAETILGQLKLQGSTDPTSSRAVLQVQPGIRTDTVQHTATSETLMEFAQRLLSVIEGTLHELQQLEAASGVKQILSVPTVSTVLAGTRVKINNAIRDYQTSVATWTAGAVHRIGKNVEMLVSSQPAAVSASLITRLPPPLPHVFHGREAEIALACDQILNHQPARIPILGAGGIGKTSLALAILHDTDIIAHFADQRLFLACDSAPDTDAVVNYLLRMLQLDVSGRDPWDALLTALDSTTTLLVLDNFETVYTGSHRQKADLLLQRLAACSHITLILTMRGASLPKSVKWSLTLLQSSLQPLSSDSAHSTFVDLGRLYSIQASVQLSIDSIPKSAVEALPLLSICSYLADGLYAGTQSSLAAVFDQPISLSADVLQRLALVYIGQHGELRMLSPIRHHVSQYYPVDPRYMDCLRRRYFQLAVESDQPMDEHFPALSALVSIEVQNLTAFLEEEIQQRPNSTTVEAVVAFSWFLYWTIPSPALATALLPHVKSSGESLELMHVLVSLLQSMHQYTDAMEIATQMRAQAADAQDTRSIAHATQQLGETERMLSNYPTARSHLQEAQNLFEGIGDRLGQAQCMRSLGDIEHALSNYPTARSSLQEAQNLFEGIGEHLGQAQCMQSLGNIERMLNNYPTARSCLQEAQDLFEGIGGRLGQAQCMRSLGDIEYMLSNYPTARGHLQEAQDLFEGIGHRLGQAQCMQSLGEIERILSNYPTARGHLKEAQNLFEGIGSRLGQAQCMQSLGEIERMLRNHPTARSLFEEAQILCEEIGNRYEQAYCMYLLGCLERDVDDYNKSLRLFTDARAIYVTIEGQADFVDYCDKNIEELHELMQTDQ